MDRAHSESPIRAIDDLTQEVRHDRLVVLVDSNHADRPLQVQRGQSRHDPLLAVRHVAVDAVEFHGRELDGVVVVDVR